MKIYLFFLCFASFSVCAGCSTTTVLSEMIQLKNSWYMSDLFAPNQEEVQEEGKPTIVLSPPPYHKYFGLKPIDYSYIYPGLKLLRCTLLSQNGNYIFEVQTDGDIELAKKYYGKAMQFGISIRGTGLNIFTTASMEEAVLVSGSGKLLLLVNKEDQLVFARWDSDYKVIARLELQIDKDCMRVYLPKEALPVRTDSWWPIGKRSFHCWVVSNLALPPLKPLPTNLPDIFYAPVVCYLTPPARSIYRPYVTHEVRELLETKEKESAKPESKEGTPDNREGK